MPAAPPRDADGNVIPHDHAEILADHHVIRHTTPLHVVDDGQGRKRIASGVYVESSEPPKGMSVDLEEWTVGAGLDPLNYVAPAHGAVELRVGDLRALGLQVGYHPLPDNPHHCEVWGVKSTHRRKIGKLATTLRKAQGET
jgi:hypothetical protein